MTTTNKMMSLGMFVFSLTTMPVNTINRDSQYEWPKNQAAGLGPVYQFNGVGAETLSLEGSLIDGITAGTDQLDKLRDMATSGKSWNLVDGSGADLGAWFISSISETRSHLKSDGSPRRVDFTLNLTLAPDLKNLGNLKDSDT